MILRFPAYIYRQSSMTAARFQKLMLLLGGALLFAAFLIAGTNALLKLVPQAEPAGPAETLAPPGEGHIRFEGPDERQSPKTFFIEPGQVQDPRPVTYTDAGFQPTELIVQASDAVGCLITVINRTVTPLRVGVNPHAVSGDPGADYGELAPGESGLYDVRYPGLTEVILHNHARPAQELKIIYGTGCK